MFNAFTTFGQIVFKSLEKIILINFSHKLLINRCFNYSANRSYKYLEKAIYALLNILFRWKNKISVVFNFKILNKKIYKLIFVN
jgi:hypothetical protein